MNPGLVVKLRPSGPWRIGPDSGARNRVDVIYHSDSLYSAVTAAMSRLGWLEEWLSATARNGSPAVSFSSCFPYLGDIAFVVPPRTVWPPASSSTKAARIRWKSARFVPLPVVQSILAGQRLDDNQWSVDGPSDCLVPSGKPGPFRTAVRSNAGVDRLTGVSERHSTGCIEFRADSGLWTVVSFADEAGQEQWSAKVKAAFRLLADTGFGGERSRGWGRSEAPEFIDGMLPDLILPLPTEGAAAPEPLEGAEAAVTAPPSVEPMVAPPSTPEPEPHQAAPESREENREAAMPEDKGSDSVAGSEDAAARSAEAPESVVSEEPVTESEQPATAVAAAASEAPVGEALVTAPAAGEPEVPAPAAETSTATAPEVAAAGDEAIAAASVASEAPAATPETSTATAPEQAAEEGEAIAAAPVASEVPAATAETSRATAPEVAAAEPEEIAAAPAATPETPVAETTSAIAPEPAAAEPSPEPEPLLPAGAPAHPHWLLSLFTPAPDDSVDWHRGNYTVVPRGGRIDSPAGAGELKKQIQMVAEGSVLYAEAPPRGSAADVAPDGFAHPVFRAGFAVAIPLPEVR